MITLTDDEWQAHQQQIVELTARLATAEQQMTDLTGHLIAAQQRIAELEATKTPPPAFVKANRPPTAAQPRTPRAPEQNRSRRRDTPRVIVAHPITQCPACQGRLSSRHVGRRRQVIDVPPPPPVLVTEHQVERGWCAYCHAWRDAPLDLTGQVVGQGRLGVGLAAVVVQLRQVVRAPIPVIQQWLASVQGVRLSVGAITDLLRRVAARGQTAAAQIRDRLRSRAVVHADETGWREGGRNGFIWELASADGDRYFAYHRSRAGAVITQMLGPDFTGVLVTDFYAGYHDTPGGRHQRCWVHLLRDLHTLKEEQVGNIAVRAWTMAVKDVYERARQITGAPEERVRAVALISDEMSDLARGYASVRGHPCQALARRLLRHQGELWQFALDPEVPPDNNQAERGIRPLVVTRKVSGGSRSPQGSATRMTLASLVQTWMAHGLNPLEEVRRLFQTPLPQL